MSAKAAPAKVRFVRIPAFSAIAVNVCLEPLLTDAAMSQNVEKRPKSKNWILTFHIV